MKDILIREYDLPDRRLLLDDEGPERILVWYPVGLSVVLGQSNILDRSVNVKAVARDNVPVYRRPSGGEAVLLTPGTLVISAILKERRFRSPLIYFQAFNRLVKESLESLGVRRLAFRGISDIAIGEKKILGSSIFRTHRKILYHAVLNVAMPVDTIETYLHHPPKEPDYRGGRPHRQFVTSLHAEGYAIERLVVGNAVEEWWRFRDEWNEGDAAVAASPPAI